MLVHPAEAHVCDVLNEDYFPMLRHLAQPLDAGRLQRNGSVEATRDSVVDDTQLLFGEQLDQVPFGLDEAGDVRVLLLFGARWER